MDFLNSSIVQSERKSVLNVHWKDCCWSWSASTLATWCEELTHWKSPWCWERVRAGGEGDGRGWDGWMASPTQWTWIWANSGWQWKTGEPGHGYQKVGRDLATEQQLVDNVTFTSDVQQNDSVIYIYIYMYVYIYIYIYIYNFFGFFSIVDYHKILNTVPCAIQ